MAFEIEIKAWAENHEELKKTLEKKYTYAGHVNKADTYFRAAVKVCSDFQDFRLRQEEGLNTVTFKEKSWCGQAEVNREREFTVSNADAFKEMMQKTGCEIFLEKKKNGWLFKKGGINIELVNVHGLGYFLEVEKILEDTEEDKISAALEEIREVLTEAGLSEDKIEKRYYSDMLVSGDICNF
jgi:adenylate cyclase class 2